MLRQPCPACVRLVRQSIRREYSTGRLSDAWRSAQLTSRALIGIKGQDARVFLQGLITNDIDKLEPSRTPTAALYSGFLSASGRILHDAFIYPAAIDGTEGYLIDVHAASLKPLAVYMRRFILRSRVSLSDQTSKFTLRALYPARDGTSKPDVDGMLWQDARSPSMGWRLLTTAQNPHPPSDAQIEVDERHYTMHRILQGVPEEPLDIISGRSLPSGSNMDYMNGVDFKKGCYVGQELTARTHHTGVVRKRTLPARLAPLHTNDDMALLLPHGYDPVPSALASDDLPAPGTKLASHKSSVANARPTGELGTSMRISDASGRYHEPITIGLAVVPLEPAARAGEEGLFVTRNALMNSDREAGVNAAGGKGTSATDEMTSLPQRSASATQWRLRAFRPQHWPAAST
ncbi:hypothetical protein E5Q_00035 [Mixia osmundae IAM 14324]|uniref:Uncharacterized protein n=1 Tax=Mixia osmundae (strain CBS 9802 / IAM 14324 / JCM 22182 / KY 12970) TaxID=764103 RepID=G7DS34_MIXOS|nr:hypothetical protein E5Q_00035 [Mixia osmundae IAM 14324]